MDEQRWKGPRLSALAASPPDELLRDISPIGDFINMVPRMIDSALALIESAGDELSLP